MREDNLIIDTTRRLEPLRLRLFFVAIHNEDVVINIRPAQFHNTLHRILCLFFSMPYFADSAFFSALVGASLAAG